MLSNDDRFYCVCCGQLLEKKEADVLFRTGYFRVVHQLGCCLACELKQSHAADLPDHQPLRSRRLEQGSLPFSSTASLADRSHPAASVIEPLGTTRWDHLTRADSAASVPVFH
ncbi:hypothetical protein PaecuDRAFT_1514 [Paenibacillus curdlanolyticus YK9]|uniref:Uncharacterized protein n=1 Tax=Paenibacillus curdlanolyticus YK9 TaxID=717606 RepID=E0I790_9BACL|nr:hypothetical protein [Paenibacillus curdlanolyticus]EFM11906.1 hypothetical protein PaecuDRAFT_1514 [Paenibacillus curdlanolyticus YK9]